MTDYFDGYASKYCEVLQRGLNATGENSGYFAQRRVEITHRLLEEQGAIPSRVVDFGCGLGTATRYLALQFNAKSVVGVDVSRGILKEAASRNDSIQISFAHIDDFEGRADLVFCNGVFHHIAPVERARALEFIRTILNDGGYFAFWENNPINPGTRYVMSKVEFDRDAVVVPPGEARALLEGNGFEIVRIRSAFFFPRALAWMRGLEKPLGFTLLGGQYLVLSKVRR